jgi:uncharacterized membrane protein
MNKGRLEAFSDGVFSIVMTLLIFSIKIPALPNPVSDAVLWQQIGLISPLLGVYFISFAVLSVLWINHHFLFHSFAKSVDRRLNLMNLTYLAFVAFVPFSADLIGRYYTHQPAAIIYGLNIFIIVAMSARMVTYIKKHKGELLNENIPQRTINQASFRSRLSLYCYIFGLIISFVSVPAALLFFAFPIIFNIIPGSLNLAEKLFGFSLD